MPTEMPDSHDGDDDGERRKLMQTDLPHKSIDGIA